MLVSRSSDHLAGVHKLYGEIWATTDPDFDAAIATPDAPRGPELLFDYATSLGLSSDDRVLDIGARDAIHAIELARRYGCQVVAADPVAIHLDLAKQRLADADPDVRARVELSDAAIEHLPFADDSFDLIIVDAFSSDAVPVHLMTAEALNLFLSKVKPTGVVVLHVSNRYLDLDGVAAATLPLVKGAKGAIVSDDAADGSRPHRGHQGQCGRRGLRLGDGRGHRPPHRRPRPCGLQRRRRPGRLGARAGTQGLRLHH